MYSSKIKIAYCLVVLLLVCSCGAEKKSLPEQPPEHGEPLETTRTNPQEESPIQPDVSSLAPPQSAEREETDMQEPEQDLDPIVWPDAALPVLEAYRAIMQEGASFVNASDGELYDIAHIKKMTAPYVDYPVEPDSFSFVDLDQDGTSELILSVPIGATGSTLIFRYEDNVVYCFGFSGRAFDQPRKDGTFWASSGANDSGICAITFSKDQYTVDEFTYCTTRESENHKVKFFVDHQEVSETELDLAVDRWREIPYVNWYEYIDENIDTIFSLNVQIS